MKKSYFSLIVVLLLHACGARGVNLLGDSPESNYARERAVSEAEKNLQVNSFAYLSMNDQGDGSSFFRDDSKANALGTIQYLGIKELPAKYLSKKQKESGKKYLLPAIELTTIVIDYVGHDTYKDCKTTLYLEIVQPDLLVFKNHKSPYGVGYGDKTLFFRINKNGKVTATEDHGYGNFVESSGKIFGELYNQILKAMPSTIQVN